MHLRPPATHVQLLLPTVDGRILTGPVTEAALTGCQSQLDEVYGWLHRGHTTIGRASGLSLRPSQFLHTPAFRNLCKAGDDKLPVMKSLRHRLQRRDKKRVDKYPCIFCGGRRRMYHTWYFAFGASRRRRFFGGSLFGWGGGSERVLWFLSWMHRGREFLVDFRCSAVPRDMDRQIRWIRDNLERGPERLKVFQVSNGGAAASQL